MKYVFLIFLLIGFASANIDGELGLDLGSEPQEVFSGGNYSINVNNTEHLQGYTVDTLWDYIMNLGNDVWLMLDQSTPQHIFGGTPTFEEGVYIGNASGGGSYNVTEISYSGTYEGVDLATTLCDTNVCYNGFSEEMSYPFTCDTLGDGDFCGYYINVTYNTIGTQYGFYNNSTYSNATYTENLLYLNGSAWSFGNSSFNQSLTDSLYYLITNPFQFFNVTGNDWLYSSLNTIYFNESKLATTFFNITTLDNVTGTSLGILTDIQIYDDISYNVTEVAGGLDFRLNFTNVSDFNQLIFRYKSSSNENHILQVQIYDYDDTNWESYVSLSNVAEYNIKEIGVYDSDEHIQNETVQIRVYLSGAGNPSHTHYFDWFTIANGLATPSGAEIDPYSYHKGEDIDMLGNNITNVTTITINEVSGACNLTEGAGISRNSTGYCFA